MHVLVIAILFIVQITLSQNKSIIDNHNIITKKYAACSAAAAVAAGCRQHGDRCA